MVMSKFLVLLQADDGMFLELIDIPGNEKLRGKFLDQFKSLAR